MDAYISTNLEGLALRRAVRGDSPLLLTMIRELAEYEKMADEVAADEATLDEWLFQKEQAEAYICEYRGQDAGYLIFFHNFSTFIGRAGMYIEDIYIRPAFRGMGLGRETLRQAAILARERGCRRLEWACLDWNVPSIGFYMSIGAAPLDEWTTYRLDEAGIARFIGE